MNYMLPLLLLLVACGEAREEESHPKLVVTVTQAEVLLNGENVMELDSGGGVALSDSQSLELVQLRKKLDRFGKERFEAERRAASNDKAKAEVSAPDDLRMDRVMELRLAPHVSGRLIHELVYTSGRSGVACRGRWRSPYCGGLVHVIRLSLLPHPPTGDGWNSTVAVRPRMLRFQRIGPTGTRCTEPSRRQLILELTDAAVRGRMRPYAGCVLVDDHLEDEERSYEFVIPLGEAFAEALPALYSRVQALRLEEGKSLSDEVVVGWSRDVSAGRLGLVMDAVQLKRERDSYEDFEAYRRATEALFDPATGEVVEDAVVVRSFSPFMR